ncbi:GNAT family N-acetyltransferase [Proteus mirabilis]|uniref:GNAT family N-acetyltransferase n=1 Tax=Proteus mirabilis TaxID=584 RepID=UPI0034DD9923
MSLKITTTPTTNEINEIYEGLLTHNLQYIQMEQYTPLAVFREENGKKIGGITGDILGNWLRICYLWVDKAYRGNNIGKQNYCKQWKIQLKRKVPNMLRWILLAFKPCLFIKSRDLKFLAP